MSSSRYKVETVYYFSVKLRRIRLWSDEEQIEAIRKHLNPHPPAACTLNAVDKSWNIYYFDHEAVFEVFGILSDYDEQTARWFYPLPDNLFVEEITLYAHNSFILDFVLHHPPFYRWPSVSQSNSPVHSGDEHPKPSAKAQGKASRPKPSTEVKYRAPIPRPPLVSQRSNPQPTSSHQVQQPPLEGVRVPSSSGEECSGSEE